jgi:glycosyltransferase involved in cell wall biosynthesis
VSSRPRVSVVIPARNAAKLIGRTLAGLESQSITSDVEVIVVDDGSTDETAAVASRSPVVTRVLRRPPTGPAASRNAGAAVARGEQLAFLDADCWPTAEWLAAGTAALEDAELVIGHTRPTPADPLGPFDRTLWVIGPSPLFESANLFVTRELFGRLQGFESWLGPERGKELGEDVWFGWRAHRARARIRFCADALVYHAVFPRRAAGFIGERARLRFFPALAMRIPELRRAFFYRRYFLSRRSAKFDLALLGVAIAAVGRSPLPLLAAYPYAAAVGQDARGDGAFHGPQVAAAGVVADAVGFAAMLYGSARTGALVL